MAGWNCYKKTESRWLSTRRWCYIMGREGVMVALGVSMK
jgi:hypothetical protein